ncbi:Hypothetical predicted protein [Prunus dulcis]|uniref:Uncharacterized protein n=1 Tax=Prunus dulcis TaxID=3755 RepID=A0A5E4F2D4_PRUDU|nr:Hypothetical predicted protein [Prunus dulcis]
MPCEWPSKAWAAEMVGVEEEESSEKLADFLASGSPMRSEDAGFELSRLVLH